jgi:hypothetical protein
MKKMTVSITAILLLLATLLTLQAGAQWTAGVKAGAGISNFDEKSAHNLRNKLGGVLGGFAQYRFQPHVSVQGEILFSMQGARMQGGSYDFNYVQVPAILQTRVWKALQILTGPQLGFLLSANVNENGNKQDISDQLSSTEFSWIMGSSYEFDNGLIIDMRYVKGLSDITSQDAAIRNNSIQLALGYRLGRRK